MNREKVAVVGASGYSGQELIRLLLRHDGVELACVTSRQYVGESIGGVYPRFRNLPGADLQFALSEVASVVASGARFAVLALPHGTAAEYVEPLLQEGVRVIDLSADFRLRDAAVYEEFYGAKHPLPHRLAEAVYGLPEFYREQIKAAKLVASPGCYPTSILIPLVPLLRKGLLVPKSIVINSLSGVSGAGKKAELDFLFVECNENARAYAVPKHRHLSEIEQELSLAAGTPVVVNFTPHLIPISRGILTTTCADLADGVNVDAVREALEEAYGNEVFVRLQSDESFVDVKHVVQTNFVDVAWRHDPRTGRVVLISAEDNLTKGAAGQAIQSLNIMCGAPETQGLLAG